MANYETLHKHDAISILCATLCYEKLFHTLYIYVIFLKYIFLNLFL